MLGRALSLSHSPSFCFVLFCWGFEAIKCRLFSNLRPFSHYFWMLELQTGATVPCGWLTFFIKKLQFFIYFCVWAQIEIKELIDSEFLKMIISCVQVFSLLCISGHSVHAWCLKKPGENVGFSGIWRYKWFWLCRCWELILWPLEE